MHILGVFVSSNGKLTLGSNFIPVLNVVTIFRWFEDMYENFHSIVTERPVTSMFFIEGFIQDTTAFVQV